MLDPNLVAQNRHVREFAEKNRLRFVRLPDGELVLPLGPRKRAASPSNRLGTHAWWSGKNWLVFAQSPKAGALANALKAAGFLCLVRDGEIEAHLDRDDLLTALDASGPAFRPWRKRVISEEQRAVTSERLRRLRHA